MCTGRLRTSGVCARLLYSTVDGWSVLECARTAWQWICKSSSKYWPHITPELGREDGRRRIRRRQSDIEMRSSPRPGGCAHDLG